MIAVVIPSYKVTRHILDVIQWIGPEVDRIIVVDDACPEHSGDLVRRECNDNRVEVLSHDVNQGVGGAVITGYKRALEIGADVVVKIDGDGQMDASQIVRLINPIVELRCDYTKGNRFIAIEQLLQMPRVRLAGNSLLSLLNKAVSGYWNVMDPTNGFTAISASALNMIPLDKLDKRYFFESDVLFRLGVQRLVVMDVAIPAKYGNEISNLSIASAAFSFPSKYANRFMKRIMYTYFLRDFNIASLEIIAGVILCSAGLLYGSWAWIQGAMSAQYASSGTVMLSALPLILGFQLLLSAINYDVQNIPRR